MTLLATADMADISFLQRCIARDTDMDSTMIRVGLLRKLLADATRLQHIEALLPRYITEAQMREIMEALEL